MSKRKAMRAEDSVREEGSNMSNEWKKLNADEIVNESYRRRARMATMLSSEIQRINYRIIDMFLDEALDSQESGRPISDMKLLLYDKIYSLLSCFVDSVRSKRHRMDCDDDNARELDKFMSVLTRVTVSIRAAVQGEDD